MQTRCPHCSTLLDVEDTVELSKIDCDSCGLSIDLLAGTTVAALRGQISSLGQFELIRQVGSGALGEVWKARDIELNRFVAIKIPHRQHLSASWDGTVRVWLAPQSPE